ncbi:MAG: hypothetical protein AVDCRST_MAG73-1022 [uncultured Thermomicrobiales bacterium]|uniref:Uncharacterized protein n=1 Tax=uncultured Thermomicrobiales bacterium TaxID=1645740 RepID=A0A6J4TV42_9BACT|nr:MAG: hypothetical protein AVDCRST_MAG73-1022 [uncultured Thermomicrobiales bacterium]
MTAIPTEVPIAFTSTRRRVLVAFLGLGAAAAAPRLARGQGTPTSDDGAIPYPTGADDLVLRVEDAGGFVPVEVNLTNVPRFSLYGDGRLILLVPDPEAFDPLASVRALMETRLSPAAVREVLAAAQTAGLLGGDQEYANAGVTDLPTTTITTNAGGAVSRVSAYGLGLPATEMTPARDRDALTRLAAFVAGLGDLDRVLTAADRPPAPEPYAIERLQLIVAPPNPNAEPVPDPAEWPLDTPLADLGDPADVGGISYPEASARCAVLAGEDAAALVDLLRAENPPAAWTSDGETFQVLFRPLLPDETGCPVAAATPAAG